jgi:hypothetical protein
MVALSSLAGAGWQFFGNNGLPLAGGKLFTYAAGTTTPLATYTSSSGVTPHANPIILDSAGRVPSEVWLTSSASYKFTLKTSANVEIWTKDNVPGIANSADLALYVLAADLDSTAAGKGAALVAGVTTAANILDYGAASTTSTSGFDSTAAILAAIATGRNVFVPPLADPSAFYRVTAALPLLSGQVLFGAGVRSMIRQTSTNTNAVVVDACTGTKVLNLGIWACGTKTSYSNGMGVDIRAGSTRCEVEGCTVKNHLGWGIGVANSSDNKILANWLIESPATDSMTNDEIGGDIYIFRSSSNNIVIGNHCISGNGVGVGVQTIDDGDFADGNQIIGNNIRDCKMYGILAYRNAQSLPSVPLQSVYGTVITGNRVRNTTGAVAELYNGYIFGAGIYIQGAEGSIVEGNSVNRTHTAPVTFVELLAPGAIGVTNTGQFKIVNNDIVLANFAGIYVNDSLTLGNSTGFSLISGNTLNEITRDGIKIVNSNRVSVINNQIDKADLRGIYVLNNRTPPATNLDNFLISVCDNVIANSGLSGLDLNDCIQLRVNGNMVKAAGLQGISVAGSTDVLVEGNFIRDSALRGIHITSTVTRAMVQNNFVRGDNSAGTVGLLLDANGTYTGNMVTNHVTDYAGTWKDMRTLTANSTTPSVLFGHAFITANTVATTITNLADGFDGQEVIVAIRDAFTTIDFTGSNMRGNGGADWAAPINGSMRCTYNRTLFAWFCMVQGA